MTMVFGVCQSELPLGVLGKTPTRPEVLRTISEIAEVGGTSIRFACVWMQLDPGFGEKYRTSAAGLKAWDTLDYCIDQSELAGLDVCLVIEPRKSALPFGVEATPKNAEGYGKLCGKIAERYGNRIKYYEICNETNSIAYFGAGKNPSKYVEFLREAFENINPLAPASYVVAGALMGAVGTSFGTLNSVEWVTEFYTAAPQPYFHMLSTHPYMTEADFDPLPVTADSLCFKNLEAVRKVMNLNGDSAKPILLTEWGFESLRSVFGFQTQAEIESEQALKLQQQWDLLETYVDNGTIHPTVFIFDYRDWKTERKKFIDFYGLVRFDWTKKPAWYWLHDKSVSPIVDAPTAAATAVGLAPVVTVYVDESSPIAPVAGAAASGLGPVIVIPPAPPAATAAAEGLTPVVMLASTDADFVSVGSGDRDTTGGADITLIWTHDVTEPGLLVTGWGTSTATGLGWEQYSPFSVTSSLDGAFIRSASRHVGASSVKRGSTNGFELYTETIGVHTITARVKKTGIDLTAVAGNTVLIRNATATGAVAANGSSTGGNVPTVSVASKAGDLVVFVFVGVNLASFSGGTIRYYDGSTVDGNGDYVLVATAPGAATVTAGCPALTHYGALAINIPANT